MSESYCNYGLLFRATYLAGLVSPTEFFLMLSSEPTRGRSPKNAIGISAEGNHSQLGLCFRLPSCLPGVRQSSTLSSMSCIHFGRPLPTATPWNLDGRSQIP
jgi:hypothetical protein